MSENNPYNTEYYSQPESTPVDKTPMPNPSLHPKGSNDRIWIGLILLIVGAVALLRTMGISFPRFIFSWQMLLIVIGLFIGARKSFQGNAWFVPVLIGSIFLINEYFLHGELQRFLLPIILISLGIFFILRPKNSEFRKFAQGNPDHLYTGQQNHIDATSIFGSTKKKVLSKNFLGGDLTNIFGGAEINLLQADISGTAVMDVTTLFGGATLLVPAHWNVISEAVAILGEVKDKRISQINIDTNKTLLIKGTVIFGGIDIKSF